MDFDYDEKYDDPEYSFLDAERERERKVAEKAEKARLELLTKPVLPRPGAEIQDAPQNSVAQSEASSAKDALIKQRTDSAAGANNSSSNTSEDAHNAVVTTVASQTQAASNSQNTAPQPAAPTTLDSVAKPAPIDAATEKPTQKPQRTSRDKCDSKVNLKPRRRDPEDGIERIRISICAMEAIRSLFPYKLNNTDLLDAFVYIHVGGGFEISEKAKEAIGRYKGSKEEFNTLTRLANIERELREIRRTSRVIEYASAVNMADRHFQVKRTSQNPATIDYRQPAVIDMLSTLRKAGAKQEMADREVRGRQIHEARSNMNYDKKGSES